MVFFVCEFLFFFDHGASWKAWGALGVYFRHILCGLIIGEFVVAQFIYVFLGVFLRLSFLPVFFLPCPNFFSDWFEC